MGFSGTNIILQIYQGVGRRRKILFLSIPSMRADTILHIYINKTDKISVLFHILCISSFQIFEVPTQFWDLVAFSFYLKVGITVENIIYRIMFRSTSGDVYSAKF